MKRRILKDVELTRIDGYVFKLERVAVHENTVAFVHEGKKCLIPLCNVGFISSVEDITPESEK